MLSSWGIAFEAANVEGNPPALQELERRGLRLVPVLTDGERTFHGWDPERLARFVGIEKRDEKQLEPAELIRRLDRILLAAERAILQVPPEGLNVRVPQRERTVRDLAFHLFRLSLAYRDACASGTFPESWLLETASPEMQDAAALARYGASVRAQLSEWLARAGAATGPVETYYGTQTTAQLLERTVWHAAQHLRQLYALLEGMGITPRNPLPAADFQGLPLPESLW
ncbi:MAG: DinB family protein [Acidobacteriia bacterium]|nr:DinB family protein [Terriglobia bacterium]